MMLNKPKVLFDAYKTYKGDGDWHKSRIATLIVLSAAVAMYGQDLANGALPSMALAVSVLAGFTFTALFSSGSLSTFDLPTPRNESDREDLKNLEEILTNFRFRARLFLIFAVTCLALILIISIPINSNRITEDFDKLFGGLIDEYAGIAGAIYAIGRFIIVLMTFFIFGEILHLFYRLSESIFSVLDIRRKYYASR